MWRRIKIAGTALLAVLALIVILQNTEQIESQFLFWPMKMPLAALLLLTLLIGFALGILVSGWLVLRRKK